jgi:hypothetical protein
VESEGEVVDGFCDTLCGAETAENAVDVPDRLERVWSMLRKDWTTDYLLVKLVKD